MHRDTTGRTGPLRNGNHRGDPDLAPRCGAKTRAGCACRAPAMENGRCRMHGGASTGPRSEAGRARISALHTRHGGYSVAMRDNMRAIDAFTVETRRILALARAGALPSDPQALLALVQTPWPASRRR